MIIVIWLINFDEHDDDDATVFCLPLILIFCLFIWVPSSFWISINKITFNTAYQLNKQLNDKERVAAALENTHLLEVVNQCLATAYVRGANKHQ